MNKTGDNAAPSRTTAPPARDGRTKAERRRDIQEFLLNLQQPGSGTPQYTRHH